MNALEKILSPVFAAINSIFDKINPRTADMIRQGFLFFIVSICIVGAVIGFTLGKKAAKKTGVQMAETTNQIFDLDIQQSQSEGRFGALLESESDKELDTRDIMKQKAPALEKGLSDETTIIEPERDRHIKSGPEAQDRKDLPSVPRLDENDPFIEDIKRAEPKHAERGTSEVTGLSGAPVIEKKNEAATKKKDSGKTAPNEDIRGPVRAQSKKSQIKPMQKKEAITE